MPAPHESCKKSPIRLVIATVISAAAVVLAIFFIRRRVPNDDALAALSVLQKSTSVSSVVPTATSAAGGVDLPVTATQTSVPATATPVPATATVTATSSPTPEPTHTPTAVAAPATPTVTVFAEPAIVTARVALNMRSGPDTTYEFITVLLNGDPITVLGQDDTGEWLNVQITDGRVGWSARAYTDFDRSAPVISPTP